MTFIKIKCIMTGEGVDERVGQKKKIVCAWPEFCLQCYAQHFVFLNTCAGISIRKICFAILMNLFAFDCHGSFVSHKVICA